MQKRMYMYKIHDTDISYLQSLSHLQTPNPFDYTAPIPSFRVSGGRMHACITTYIYIHIYIYRCVCGVKKGYPYIDTYRDGRTDGI